MSKCAVSTDTSDSITDAVTESNQNSVDPFFEAVDDLTMAEYKNVDCNSDFSYNCEYDPSPDEDNLD